MRATLLAGVLLVFSCSGTASQRVEPGVVTVSTADGILILWNRPGLHLAIRVSGKDVSARLDGTSVTISVDGTTVHLESEATSEFLADENVTSELGILEAHRDWEAGFAKLAVASDGREARVSSTTVTLSNGARALAWHLEVDGAEDQVRHLAVLRDGLVVTLWARAGSTSERESVQRRLDSILATLQLSNRPIHVKAT